MRQKSIFVEFVHFLERYLEAKKFLEHGHYLDAFHCTIFSLQHWARLAVIEVGNYPGDTVWEQIKQIDPSIYKLYEELITSHESVPQRLQLLHLAFEFAIMSRLEQSTQFLLSILRSEQRPWTTRELSNHPMLTEHLISIDLLLQKMAKRSLVRESMVIKEGNLEKVYSIV
jgi:hypothetical protein